MWYDMRGLVFHTIKLAVEAMKQQDIVPKSIMVTGHSMSGGVST